MKISLSPSRRGFAVIVCLVAVTVLSILAGALALFMKVESQLAQNSNDGEKLLWIARGGVERACWILAQEPQGPSSLQQIWAGGPGDGPETNSPLMGITLDDFPVGDGSVSLKMIEQESKVNINTADVEMLHNVLTTMGVDASDISLVTDSILDWIDTDDANKPAGAESDYYQGLNPPYNAKNAPIDDIQELQFIKGVTPEMFKGGSAEGADSPFKKHKLGFGHAPGEAADYPFGLRDVFTPYSIGKININTADTNVLALIPGMDTASIQNLMAMRSSEGGFGDGTGVIRDLSQLRAVVPSPEALQQISRYCTVRGETYEVHATARAGASQREFVAVVYRNGRSVQVVGFHPK
ncbi:MAG TPA: general secretion pathway protein GspK [bacterium]|nr:general secretion pathway protein GspK [bacterium]